MPLTVPVVSTMSRGFKPASGEDGYLLYGGGSTASMQLATEDLECCFPVFIPRAATATEISIYLRTGQTDATIRLGWRADSDFGPGALIVDAGTVDAAGAAGVRTATGSWVVPAGVSWITATWQGGSTGPSIDGSAINENLPWQYMHTTTNLDNNNFAYAGRGFTGVSGALPALPTYTNATGIRNTVVPYFQVLFP